MGSVSDLMYRGYRALPMKFLREATPGRGSAILLNKEGFQLGSYRTEKGETENESA